MSLKKKDPSAAGGLRVAANDPHLVSLGGGRLSTAVTIHYIPIGSITIGSSTNCTISLNGSGVQTNHCTLIRNDNGEVKIIPNNDDARVLIDGNKITNETNLTQGAMITIGNSNYLRFNNPAEAQMIKSTMGSNERISMPQIDFTQNHHQQQQQNDTQMLSLSSNSLISSGKGGVLNNALKNLNKSYDSHNYNQNKTIINNDTLLDKITKIEYINIHNFHSPKVFTADSITVNAPAKDVLGPKYANFAKNLTTNHKNDKNYCVKNNEMNFTNNSNHMNANNHNYHHNNSNTSNRIGNYVNIPPSNFIQNSSSSSSSSSGTMIVTTTASNEILTKVNNSTSNNAVCNCVSLPSSRYYQHQQPQQQQQISAAYERYPKISGGLQLFPMNGINSEINIDRTDLSDIQEQQQGHQKTITAQEQERLDEILKICTEYERQQSQQHQQCNNINGNGSGGGGGGGSGSIQSSPIVQNRIKTNGSLPRDKKSPFFDINSQNSSTKIFFPSGIGSPGNSSINNSSLNGFLPTGNSNNSATSNTSSGYENVRIINDRRIEIGQSNNNNSGSTNFHNHYKNSSGYENVIIGKYTPQSPRTKIRTTCISPQKKDVIHPLNISSSTTTSIQNHNYQQQQHNRINNSSASSGNQSNEYAHLIQTFEDKLKMEMQAIQECTKPKEKQQQSSMSTTTSNVATMTNSNTTTTTATIVNGTDSLRKRQNLNINNLTLNLNGGNSITTSMNSLNDNFSIKSSSATENDYSNRVGEKTNDVDNNNSEIMKYSIDNLKKDRENVLAKIRKLKTQIAEIQRQEDEVLRELDLEKALVSAEMSTVNVSLVEMEKNFKSLQSKIHRLEAQRNANRVMQETQQAKLKQSIEYKQEQVAGLKKLLKGNENDESLKNEYEKLFESLENDRKLFEDLEFQYLEEETDWMAYREELHTDLKNLTKHIENKQMEMINLQSQGIDNQNSACTDTKTLETNLLSLLKELEKSREELKCIDKTIYDKTGEHVLTTELSKQQSDSDEDEIEFCKKKRNDDNIGNMSIMSQSLFGSTEILSAKSNINLMSRSINENMFFNNNIEMPQNDCNTSTPKKELKVFEINDDINTSMNTGLNLNKNKDNEIIPEIVKREHSNDEKDPILKLKYNVKIQNNNDNEDDDGDGDISNQENNKNNSDVIKTTKVSNLNLSLEGDDFEVNPLDKRIPSQDDIDRICKVTLDAPISTTKGASSKIIESIKEIERNRQLLLAQQGSHVIEHERQKMMELKKRCHDEARAQYLSSHNIIQQQNNSDKSKSDECSEGTNQKYENDNTTKFLLKSENCYNSQQHEPSSSEQQKANQQRHSHPEFESQHSRPLSDCANYDKFKEKQFKSNNDLTSSTLSIVTSTNNYSHHHHHQQNHHNHHHQHHHNSRFSENSEDDGKRSSLNSNNTLDDDRPHNGSNVSNCSNNSNNKRTLQKHQRPLTRYLPIMSPDLDLRQHIESAGHQISLCPHVIIDSYSCRGYLHKLGATFHGWSRRWFVLDRQKNAFIYYSDRSERKPRGGAYFSTIDEVYLDHLNTSKSGRPHCTFIVKTKRRSYHLQAASDAAARIWIDAIITGAQGNIDY